MAQATFSFDEMVYNSIVSGKQIWHKEVLYTIDYVKFSKLAREILVVCTDGTAFKTSQDEPKLWEVNTVKEFVKPTKEKLK